MVVSSIENMRSYNTRWFCSISFLVLLIQFSHLQKGNYVFLWEILTRLFYFNVISFVRYVVSIYIFYFLFFRTLHKLYHSLVAKSGKSFGGIKWDVRCCILQSQIKDISPAENLGNRGITWAFRAAFGFTIQKELFSISEFS